MPIELPVLDDKTYAELVQEARTAIPGNAPEWTDHNPSDPGIALVELLAWLTDLLIYRAGRIPDRCVHSFLSLLNGQPVPEPPLPDLEAATRSTLRALRERWRAVTPEDYEDLALSQWPAHAKGQEPTLHPWEQQLARVRCLAERDLSSATPSKEAPGHVSLIVLPRLNPEKAKTDLWDGPREELLEALQRFFRERRLVSTRLHVTRPAFVPVDITATVYLRDDADLTTAKDLSQKVLEGYFDPRSGGPDGRGWPFGREVPASEIYAKLDATQGVEFVDSVTLNVEPALASRRVEVGPATVAIWLEPHELPKVEPQSLHLTFKERHAGLWRETP